MTHTRINACEKYRMYTDTAAIDADPHISSSKKTYSFFTGNDTYDAPTATVKMQAMHAPNAAAQNLTSNLTI